MSENLKTRTVLVLFYLLFCFIYLLPNMTKLPKDWWFHKQELNYGLDIKGGAHLVYGVDVQGVVTERTQRMARALATELKEKGVEATVELSPAKDALLIKAANPADGPKITSHLHDVHGTTLQITSDSGGVIEARYFDAVLTQYREQVINQAIEVIRNRVDQFGVAEPVIAAQGSDRILVQLPGITDPANAKALINKTARLDFRLVDRSMQPDAVAKLVADAEKEGHFSLGSTKETASEIAEEEKAGKLPYQKYVAKVNEMVKSKLPKDTMITFEKAPQAANMENGKIAYLLRTDTDISGDQLEDAFLSYGQYGEPKVSFRFGSEGRKKFADVTAKNVGHQLAVVLDEVIFTAPNIQERIDGEGQISLGNRNNEDASKEGALIATALRAGALPVALTQLEERSVGPSLGADSIQKGKMAALIGIGLVVIFISLYYKMAGVLAGACLILNVFGLLAILSALGATITLPGIAGVTLTVGMAVDANVLVFERIKEELRRGIAIRAAVADGFKHAWSAIFDANVTHAIAASVLIYFGSGPVRGFGTTLIAGIVTTVITSIFVTRYLIDLFVAKSSSKSISI
jgi:preprotein translocase subunit SecD